MKSKKKQDAVTASAQTVQARVIIEDYSRVRNLLNPQKIAKSAREDAQVVRRFGFLSKRTFTSS